MQVDSQGVISPLNAPGEILIDNLRLDNEDHTLYRHTVLRTLANLYATDDITLKLWLSYPGDLPDLAQLRPIGNTRPEGMENSFYARMLRKELPDIY
jgi:hypothetical protein